MKLTSTLIAIILSVLFSACGGKDVAEPETEAYVKLEPNSFYSTTKPCTRWWWFATEVKKPDIKHQLDWAKKTTLVGLKLLGYIHFTDTKECTVRSTIVIIRSTPQLKSG